MKPKAGTLFLIIFLLFAVMSMLFACSSANGGQTTVIQSRTPTAVIITPVESTPLSTPALIQGGTVTITAVTLTAVKVTAVSPTQPPIINNENNSAYIPCDPNEHQEIIRSNRESE